MRTFFSSAVTLAMVLSVGTMDLDAGVKSLGTIQGHKGAVNTVEFSKDSQTILSGSADGSVKTWNVESGELLKRVGRQRNGVSAAVFSPDNNFVVTAGNRKGVQIWEASTGKLQRSLAGAEEPQMSVAASPDGQYIASGAASDKVTIWRTSEMEPIHVLNAHDGPISQVVFSPDSQYLVSIGTDATIKVWEVTTGYRAFSMRAEGPLNDVAFSPSGKNLAVAGQDVKIFVLRTGQVIKTLNEHSAPIRTVAYSPNGKFLVTGSSDKTAKIWALTSGRVMETLEAQDGAIISAEFSPNGLFLATGSEKYLPAEGKAAGETSIAVWNLEELYSDGKISRYIERKLYHWKRKGEFEKLADFQARMDKIDLEAGRLFAEAYRRFGDDIREGATISSYDAENEQFTVGLPTLGQFAVHVPISKAKVFKKNFSEVIFRNFIVDPEIRVPSGSSWKLKKVELYLPSIKQSFFYGDVK